MVSTIDSYSFDLGSIPRYSFFFCFCSGSSVVEHRTENPCVGSSILPLDSVCVCVCVLDMSVSLSFSKM